MDDYTTKNWLKLVVDYVDGIHNNTSDIDKPFLRNALVNWFWVVIIFYAILCVVGILLNSLEIYIIAKNRLFRDPTYSYLINISIIDIVQCVLVIPLSLHNLLIQNWVIGSFFCYFIPMLQDMPIHVIVLTILMIVWDRYKFLEKPSKSRFNGCLVSLAAWLTAMCVVLPYPLYTTFVDIGIHLHPSIQKESVGICVFGLNDDLREYSHATFTIMFLVPLIVTIFLFGQIVQVMRKINERVPIYGFQTRLRGSFVRHCHTKRYLRSANGQRNNNFDDDNNIMINPKQEEETLHKYVGFYIIVFFVCYGSILMLKTIHLESEENYDNSDQWDILFVVIVWIAYLPIVIKPIIILLMTITLDDIFDICNWLRLKNNNNGGPTIRLNSMDEEESNYTTGTLYQSRPSAATVSTSIDIIAMQERKQSTNTN